MCFGGGGGDGGAGAAAAQEAQRQSNITSGNDAINTAFAGFDQPFYDKEAKAYTDYAQPQVDRQWADATSQLHYALDRGGIQNSSAAGKAQADAQFTHDQAEQGVANTASETVQNTRSQVAAARQQLSGQLNADANASEAATNASNQSRLLGVQPSFSPIGNLFQNTTAGLSLYAQGAPLLGTPGYVGQAGVGGPSASGGGGVSLFPQ